MGALNLGESPEKEKSESDLGAYKKHDPVEMFVHEALYLIAPEGYCAANERKAKKPCR